jgi:hypothetical protein
MSQSHIELFKKLGNYNPETHETRFVNVSEFIGEYASLQCNNGGGWCRLDVIEKKYKALTIKKNGEIRFSRNCTEEDKASIQMPKIIVQPGNSILLIKIINIYVESSGTRSIRADIYAVFKDSVCVSCGSGKIEIDHKNGLYNDPRVLSQKTQRIDDFQPLCKHCNDVKRQTYVWQTKNGRRYPATNIPMLQSTIHQSHRIDYVEGDETYDAANPDAMVGTYWYDPVEFIKKRDAIIATSSIIIHIPQ